MTSRTIYLVVTGAPLTRRATGFVPEARARSWQPAVIATSSARAWLDLEALKGLDVPLLSEHRGPDEPKRLPPADAVVVAPATFNTINKLAAGIADTYPLATLCEAVSRGTPMVVVPFVSTRLSGHPAWPASLAVLRSAGAVLVDSRTGEPYADPMEPGMADGVTAGFSWAWVLDRLPA